MRTTSLFVVALVALLGTIQATGALGAVSRTSDRASVVTQASAGGGCNPNGDKEAQDFQSFNQSLSGACSASAGSVTVHSSQNTTLEGTRTRLKGVSSRSTGSAHVAGNGVPFPTVNPPSSSSRSELAVFVQASAPVQYHLGGTIDASVRGQANLGACVQVSWAGKIFDVSQNPGNVGCGPSTGSGHRRIDDSGTVGAGELDITRTADVVGTKANTASGTATASWNLTLEFCTIVAQPLQVTQGTPGNDVICGTESDDLINGSGGNDIIFGNGGNDTIGGGSGNDTIDGGNGDDVLQGGADADKIDGGPGNEVAGQVSGIEGGPGPDVIQGGEGDDLIEGQGGSDAILGEDGSDKLRGQGSGDCLDGGSRKDVLVGGAENDKLQAKDGARDEVHGNGGSGDKAQVDRQDSVDGVEDLHPSAINCLA